MHDAEAPLGLVLEIRERVAQEEVDGAREGPLGGRRSVRQRPDARVAELLERVVFGVLRGAEEHPAHGGRLRDGADVRVGARRVRPYPRVRRGRADRLGEGRCDGVGAEERLEQEDRVGVGEGVAERAREPALEERAELRGVGRVREGQRGVRRLGSGAVVGEPADEGVEPAHRHVARPHRMVRRIDRQEPLLRNLRGIPCRFRIDLHEVGPPAREPRTRHGVARGGSLAVRRADTVGSRGRVEVGRDSEVGHRLFLHGSEPRLDGPIR